MAAPWEKYGGAQPQAGPMYGAPPLPPDQFKIRDQQLQEEAAARAREDQQFQREKFNREMAKSEKDPKTTADQKVSAGYYARALNAHKLYGQGIEPRDGFSQMAVDHLPRPIVNQFTSEPRKEAENYADEFIRAKLRRESGASIAPDEMRREYEVYFPVPGDTEADRARKAKLREQAIEGLRVAAGEEVNNAQLVGDAPAGPGKRLPPEKEQELIQLVNSGASPEQIDQFLSQFGLRSPNAGKERTSNALDYSKIDAPVQAQIDAKMQQHGGVGAAAMMGATDAVTLGLGDEIAAGGNAFIGALQGQGSIGDLYSQNIQTERGYRQELSNEHPIAYTGGQLGGAVVPFGAAATGVGGLAKAGAIQGGAYGFGSAEGNPLQRLPGAALGAGVGGAVGAGLGALAPHAQNALARFLPQRPAQQAEMEAGRAVIEAGQRQNVPIRQPDVRPGLRGDLAAIEKSPSAGPMVGDTLRADKDAVEGRVAQLANGEAKDEYALGNQVQGAVERHNQRTRDEATVNYFRARKMAPNHKADGKQTIAAIDSKIAELAADGETANAAEIKVLEGIKSDLSKSGLSIDSLQTQRKQMRQRLKNNGIDTPSGDASYMEIMDLAGRELEASLDPIPNAKAALRKANAHYAERKAFRTEIAKQFTGTRNAPIAPEAAAKRFVSMTKNGGDYNRFSRMFKEMDEAERGDFAATIAKGLGRGKNGEFGLGALVTDLEGMNPRAIRDLYGKDGAEALADLKIIAAAKRDTAAGLNHSNTGAVVARQGGFKDLLLAAFGGGMAGVPGAVAGYMSRGALEKFTSRRAARMLLNPDFTKWLRQTPNSTKPAVINRHFARLTQLAAKNPTMAADARALQQFLGEAFQPTTRAAASGSDTDRKQ